MALAGCATPGTPAAGGTAGSPGIVKVVPQRDWTDAVLYFVILDRYADGSAAGNLDVDRANPGGFHGGDFVGLLQQLDEIASLGATAVWITPIVRQIDHCPPAQPPTGVKVPGGWFEHCAFHGYWADDFTRLDPRFGTEAELKRFVDAAHGRGLKVLLDVVYNHVGYDASYEKNPATAAWIRPRPVDCAVDELHCQVGGLPDLKTELPEVRQHLFDAHMGLAQRTGLDGFRLDTVKHIDHDFWRRHRQETRARLGDDFFLLAEVWGGSAQVLDDYFAADEMDAGFDFTFKGSCEAFVQGKGRTIAFAAYLEKRHKVRDGFQLAHYLSSHDEPMALHNLKGDLDAFRLCVALQMTSLGIPTVYYGEEVARQGSVWPVNRGDMPWGKRAVLPGKGIERDESLREYYRRLIAARRANTALSRGAFKRHSSDGDLLVFERTDPASGNAVIVAVNRGQVEATGAVPAPPAWQGGAVKDVVTGAAAALSGGQLAVTVPARQARVYVHETTG
ncbi:MAG TPA: alpha-amylase family glycosyl hydrolase [Steroidobacteraceae bacterium]|nr:alpha-amylase family glycosyl hydrolase [Steroidobacteraceae bacterium]